jgi:FdrA protein
MDRAPGSNVAVISVPGDYAALEAHHALSAGLDVLLFSDNVSVAAEVQLKQRAQRLGRLVMGPGAGTAMLGGICLGFANVTAPGSVAVVAAAGTGAQEAMSLLDRWGVGVSHVIGLGGRDLSAGVGGIMARSALHALAGDEGTEVILLVSKPPSPEVAHQVLPAAGGKPVIAALLGLPGGLDVPDNVTLATTLETGVLATLATLGVPAPNPAAGLRERVAGAIAGLAPQRRLVRGLFSGGTLCYESLVILSAQLGPVYSNTPLDPDLGLPAPAGSHTCLDLGEEEYTKGRPHPMIDPEARIELLREQGTDPDVAVIILDVVLGYGAHEDPAAELAPVCAAITAKGGPIVAVYVLGTHADPQGFDAQRQAFSDAGCVVTETAARASLAAAAIARRDPELCEARL